MKKEYLMQEYSSSKSDMKGTISNQEKIIEKDMGKEMER